MRTYQVLATLLLMPVLALSLGACGGTGGASIATATATPDTSTNQPGTGPQRLPLYCPLAVAVDKQDQVYVSDNDPATLHQRVIKLSPSGQELAEWHLFAFNPRGTTQGPGDLALDAQGNLYVIDLDHNSVVKVSPGGKLLARWGSQGSGPGQFERPEGLVIDSRGTVSVGDWDSASARIEQFSDTGNYLGTVKVPLKAGPLALAVDSSDQLFVANDTTLTRVSLAGHPLASLQLSEPKGVAFSTWTGLAINARGDFAAASLTQPIASTMRYPRLLKLDLATGKDLATWKVWQTGIAVVESLALDSQGNLYATEMMQTGAMQLQKFSSTGEVLAAWKGTCGSS